MTFQVSQGIEGMGQRYNPGVPDIQRLFAEAPGAAGPFTLPLLAFLSEYQRYWKVEGHIAEIGILFGTYLIGLSYLAGQGERVVGLDVFDDQVFNIDHAGESAEDVVRTNIARHAPSPDAFDLIKGDSTSYHSAYRLRQFVDRYQEFRIFSVDGCHLKHHTMADIAFGASVIANGGLLIIDDFTNDGWPGVADGTSHYFSHQNVRLAPLAVCFNKLICTTISHHSIYYDALAAWVNTPEFQRHYAHAKPVPIYERTAWHINQFLAL